MISEIGRTLKALRKVYKVTQMEMARFCKIHPRQYQRIEAGKANMGIETFLTLIDFFDMNPDAFFRLAQSVRGVPPLEKDYGCNIKAFACCEMRRFLIRNTEIAVIEPLLETLKAQCVDILFQNKENLQDGAYIACHLDQNHHCLWTNSEGVRFWGLKNGQNRLCCQNPVLGSGPERAKEICCGPSRGTFWCHDLVNSEGETRRFLILLFPVYKMINVKSETLTRLCFDITDMKINVSQMLKSF